MASSREILEMISSEFIGWLNIPLYYCSTVNSACTLGIWMLIIVNSSLVCVHSTGVDVCLCSCYPFSWQPDRCTSLLSVYSPGNKNVRCQEMQLDKNKLHVADPGF